MLSRIVGQIHAKKILIRAFEQDLLAHAYLISGEEGAGGEELALEFARYILCTARTPESLDACGQCPSCVKVVSFQHPDVHYYFPILKSTTAEEWRGLVETKEDSLYSRVRVGGGSIHIGDRENPEENSVRALIRQSGLHAYEGKYKIFIVTFAEDMNNEAANALLKVLEEPPSQTLFLLTTAQLNLILPTIQSRCQIIKLRPVSSADIKDRLQDLSKIQASRIAKLADGNYYKALLLKDGRYEEMRETMLEFLSTVLSSRPQEIVNSVEQILVRTEKDKDRVIEFLNLLSVWFHDVLTVMAFNGKPEATKPFIVNEDLSDRLARFVQNFPSLDIDKSQVEIEKAVDLISRNVYLNLILIHLGLKIRQFALLGPQF